MTATENSAPNDETKSVDARIRRSREALIEAGRELLNQNYETSLSDIARHAGVGRTTLYRLFETKKDLVTAIALDCLETFARATEHLEHEASSALDAIGLLYRAIIPLSSEMQFLMGLSSYELEDPELLRLLERQENEMREVIELAKQEGSIDPDLPTEWLIHALDALFYPAWVLRGHEKYSDDTLAEFAFRSFCHGAALQS